MLVQPSLTPRDVAAYLGLRIGTIYAYLHDGKITGSRVGNRRYISWQSVEEFQRLYRRYRIKPCYQITRETRFDNPGYSRAQHT